MDPDKVRRPLRQVPGHRGGQQCRVHPRILGLDHRAEQQEPIPLLHLHSVDHGADVHIHYLLPFVPLLYYHLLP